MHVFPRCILKSVLYDPFVRQSIVERNGYSGIHARVPAMCSEGNDPFIRQRRMKRKVYSVPAMCNEGCDPFVRQKQGSDLGAKSPSGSAADRASYVVFRQPLAMDRFTLHDIAAADASGRCTHAHTHTHTHTHTRTHAVHKTYTCKRTYTHTRGHTYTRTNTHTR